MFKCEYCDRELKSKAGKVRHERSCKVKNVDIEQLAEDVAVIDNKPKEIEVELMGTATYPTGKNNNYYEGHPRRAIKLRGLLSRTFDDGERNKILQMLKAMR